MLQSYTCGHVGKTNDSYRKKAEAFIRVAEIRGEPVESIDKSCPECKGR